MINHQPYYPALDGTRGLGMILVLLTHMTIIRFGWLGLEMFFVLSGYLITEILIREKERTASLYHRFRNFWARRVLRIFPLYYLYLLVLVVIWLFDQSPSFGRQVPYLFTYTYNFTFLSEIWQSDYPVIHLWSLAAEEQFYLLYPFLILLCPARFVKPVVIILIAGAVFFRIGMSHCLAAQGYPAERIGGIIHALTFTHFDSFLAGGAIVIFRLTSWSMKKIQSAFIFFFISLIAAGILIYLDDRQNVFHFNDYITDLGLSPEYTNYYSNTWINLLVAGLFSCIILMLLSPGKKGVSAYINRLFSWSLLVKIGKVSYGIYIIHLGVLWLIPGRWIAFNKYLVFIPYAIVCYAVAFALYHIYERKFLQLKERFR